MSVNILGAKNHLWANKGVNAKLFYLLFYSQALRPFLLSPIVFL